jgi:hypothetical protein
MTAITNFTNAAHKAKDWVVENQRQILAATLIASLATTIIGFAVMGAAQRIYSVVHTIGCTMSSCSLISHYSLDPTFLKGVMIAVSGLFAAYASKAAL